jgi:hypothetical protein
MARLLPRFSSNDSPDAHWIHRVTENLRAAFLLSKYVRSSSNGAPLHFADIDLSARRGSAKPMPLSFTPPCFARFFSF